MTELGAGAVTVADLYREIVGMRQDITKALTRIEVIDSRNMDADQLHRDHEARLRVLEAFRWKLAGVCTAAGAAAGGLATWLGLAVAHH